MASDAELTTFALPEKDTRFTPITKPPIVSFMERDVIEKPYPRTRSAMKKRTRSDSLLKKDKRVTLPPERTRVPMQVQNQYYDYNLRRSPSLVLEHAIDEYRSNSAPQLSSQMKEGDISEDYGFYDHSFKGGIRRTKQRRGKSKKNKYSRRAIKTRKMGKMRKTKRTRTHASKKRKNQKTRRRQRNK